MPREILNNGTVANDGSGDSLRDAITKINNNFSELYNKIGGTTTGAYLSPSLRFDSDNVIFGTTNEMSLGTVTLTASRSIQLPDLSGTLLVNQDNQEIRNPKTFGNLLDSNLNELLTFTSGNTSAVNNVSLSNSATGNAAVISTAGDDSDVNLNLETKGGGELVLNAGLVYSTQIETDASVAMTVDKPMTIFNRATAVAATLTTSSLSVGHHIRVININTGLATITSTFHTGTTVTVPEHNTAEFIWTGSDWLVHGDDSVSIA
jgi:hypothetical protein